MALLGTGGSSKFNREQWRTELGPVIELWDRLTKSSRDVLSRPARAKEGDGKNSLLPLPQFVDMESKFAYDIVNVVDNNMKALKRVVFGSGLVDSH